MKSMTFLICKQLTFSRQQIFAHFRAETLICAKMRERNFVEGAQKISNFLSFEKVVQVREDFYEEGNVQSVRYQSNSEPAIQHFFSR